MIPRTAVIALAVTALLSACGNSTAPTAQTTTSAAASAAPAGAVGAADAPLRADLATLAACTYGDTGINYCAELDALSKKLPPAGEARRAAVRGCFGLLHDHDPALAHAAATCVASYSEKSQVDEILGALEKATESGVRVELSRGVDRLRAEEGAPAAHAVQMARALTAKPGDRFVPIHLLSSLMPEDEKKDVTPEAFALALELFNSPDRAPYHSAAYNILISAPSRLPEVCKLFAGLVETSTDDWVSAASTLADHKACEAELARVFPTLIKKITTSDGGKGVTASADLRLIEDFDAQNPLSAAQKKSLVTAIDTLAKRAETDDEKRLLKAIHEHFSK